MIYFSTFGYGIHINFSEDKFNIQQWNRRLIVFFLADVEIEREGGEFQILEELGPNETMDIEEEELSVLPARKIISHLPIRVRRGLRKYESDLSRDCLLYTSPSPRDRQKSRMPSSA